MNHEIDTDTVQILDQRLAHYSPPRPGRGYGKYIASDGDEWIISEPRSYTRGIWQFQHTDTETEPDGEGGMQPTDNRHGTGDGLLDCLVQIEKMIAEAAE